MADEKTSSLTGGEVQDLLRREREGNLSEKAKTAIAHMRSAGEFPAPLEPLTTAQKIVRQSALPMIGGALGSAAGTIAAPFTGGIANPVTGGMAGAALGEFANQQLGITQPSGLNIAVSGAMPAVPAAARGIVNQLPGAAAGLQKVMQGSLGQNMEKVLQQIAPQRPAREIWQETMALGRPVHVQARSLKTAVNEMGDEIEQLVLPAGKAGTLVKSLSRLAEGPITRQGSGRMYNGPSNVNFVPMEQFRANMSELGRVVRQLEEQGGRAAGQAKQLYRAMWDDLNAAVNTAHPDLRPALTAAVDATKREAAHEFLTDAVTKSVSYRLGHRQIDTNGLLTKIERNKELLGKWLPKEDIQHMKDTLIPWAKTTPMMPSAIPRSSTEKLLGTVTGADTIARILLSPAGRESVRAIQSPTFDQAVNTIGQAALSASGMRGQMEPMNLQSGGGVPIKGPGFMR